MKKYRLKQWYPSLDSCWEVEDIAYYYRNGVYWNDTRVVENGVSAKEVENNPDFWELIEEKSKPLFITEDGVEVFDGDVDVFTTNSSFNKYRFKAKRIKDSGLNHKIFYHESNLYNYIWRNKPVFSYEDIIDFNTVEEGMWYNIKAIAKERSEE